MGNVLSFGMVTN